MLSANSVLLCKLHDGNAPIFLFLPYSNLRNGMQQELLHVEAGDSGSPWTATSTHKPHRKHCNYGHENTVVLTARLSQEYDKLPTIAGAPNHRSGHWPKTLLNGRYGCSLHSH